MRNSYKKRFLILAHDYNSGMNQLGKMLAEACRKDRSVGISENYHTESCNEACLTNGDFYQMLSLNRVNRISNVKPDFYYVDSALSERDIINAIGYSLRNNENARWF